jgi:hypothetical protein
VAGERLAEPPAESDGDAQGAHHPRHPEALATGVEMDVGASPRRSMVTVSSGDGANTITLDGL